jgi:hypothetical protein
MIMKRLVLMSLAAVAAATAFSVAAHPDAAQSASSGGKCFWTRDLRNHTVGDSHTLYFDVGGRDVYRVTTSDACLAGVTSSDPIVMLDRASTGRICDKLDWDISVRGAHCIVSGMSRLTAAEAAALPKHVKP